MRTITLGRIFGAAVLVAGSVLATPVIAASSPAPQAKAQTAPTPAQLSLELNCTVDGAVTLGPGGRGSLTGIYMATYRACIDPSGRNSKYVQWNAIADPVNVTSTSCPPTGFTGSAKLWWTDRDTMTVEPGKATYIISLDLNNFTGTLDITITDGPMSGTVVTAPVALLPGSPGTFTCNGLPLPSNLLIQGDAIFHPA
ncbi:hypothetical protein [Nocardia brasiliensis]|uniref:hypothetical protein n=1 Tax=Nocardia brasiliensis TaxID=37326 RepID=UPI00367285FF